jgi:phospholipid/cholesterol/gamma-HCH transport system permease protein
MPREWLAATGEISPFTGNIGYNASGGPVGVGEATAKSMVLNLVLVTLIGMLGTQVFWGTNPRAPIGG